MTVQDRPLSAVAFQQQIRATARLFNIQRIEIQQEDRRVRGLKRIHMQRDHVESKSRELRMRLVSDYCAETNRLWEKRCNRREKEESDRAAAESHSWGPYVAAELSRRRLTPQKADWTISIGEMKAQYKYPL
jgi:hypothetical protein